MAIFNPEAIDTQDDVLSSPLRNNFNSLQTLLAAGLGDDQFADHAISEVKLSFTNGIWRHSAVPWTKVIDITGVGTVSDTDVDLTSATSSATKAVMLWVRVVSGNVTNSTYVGIRKKGDSTGDTSELRVFAPPANGYYSFATVIVGCDTDQKITYRTNANPASFTVEAWVIGYLETT
jgi:hypothetical protein